MHTRISLNEVRLKSGKPIKIGAKAVKLRRSGDHQFKLVRKPEKQANTAKAETLVALNKQLVNTEMGQGTVTAEKDYVDYLEGP